MEKNRLPSRKKENAQGVVEFALILPILLLVVLGIVEFGRMLFFYSSVTSASREGARYGSAVGEVGGVSRYKDCAGIRDAALRAGVFAGITDSDITIQYDDGSSLIEATCPPSATISLADRVVVTVVGNYQPIAPLIDIFFPDDGFDIASTTARTIIKEVGVRGTPAPTATLLPAQNSPTPTPTDTPTPTPTFTFTPTETHTPTSTSTSTETPTWTPGPTATPSNTPTFTPTPPCPSPNGLTIGPAGKKITFSIGNPDTNYVYTIERIYIDWPNDAELDKISFSTLSESKINNVSGEYSIDPGWSGTFTNPDDMVFTFVKEVTSPLNVQVTFRNCEVISGSR